MIYTPMTKKALKLCFDAHRDQLDKAVCLMCSIPFIWQSRWITKMR